LADNFLVRSLDRDLGLIRHGDFDVSWNRKYDWVRETETQIQILPLHCSLETDAFDLQIFRKTFTDADDHIVNERARKAMQRFHAARFCAARERHVIVFHAASDMTRQLPAQLAFWPFD